MANFCLIPSAVEDFKGKLRDGTIDPYKLGKMTSEERHKFFAGIAGEENAKGVNALFESKMLLKNQQYAYTAWAKKVAGITPEVRRDLISKISKLDKVLNPDEEKMFLKDLAATKLGVDVTAEEAKNISKLSDAITNAQSKMDNATHTFKNETDRMAYGHSIVDLGEYVDGLKQTAEKKSVIEYAKNPAGAVKDTGGFAKSIKAAFDNSAIFRQGWKTLWTNPVIWQKNARQTFVDLYKDFGKARVMKELHAEILSRPNAINGKYKKMGIAISKVEEAYPTSTPEKIPLLGRFYRSSESAYTAFLYRQRADIADQYLKTAEKMGVNIEDKDQLRKIGKLINSLTGRADLGRFEGTAADSLNNIFFSVRFLKSNIDTLTMHQFQSGASITNRDAAAKFVRKKAATNLLKMAIGTAAIMITANKLRPGSAEFDPRSKDFGKIRIGNTRFDVTGGMGSFATLVAQIASQSTKSTSTGQVNKLNSGFGSPTGMDIFNAFFENKASPMFAALIHQINQDDGQGNKPTIVGELSNMFVPLPASTFFSTKADPNGANPLITLIADGLGLASNTSGKSNANWQKEPNKTLSDFQTVVGADKYKQANADYNKAVDQWNKDNRQTLAKALPDQRSQIVIDAKKNIQAQIFHKYAPDKYKAPKTIDGTKINFGNNEVTDKGGILDAIGAYASAFKTSPGTAFNRIFSGQRILRTTNGAIIVERMPVSSSQGIKKEQGGNNKEMKLDHTIPLQLGGSNERGNLKLVSTDTWAKYTPVEDYLGRQLKAKSINAKEATKLISDFKSGRITAQDVYNYKK